MNEGEQGANGTQENQDNLEGLTQESIAAELAADLEANGGAGVGTGGDEGGAGVGADGDDDFKIPLDEETLGIYAEALNVEIKDDFFKDENGKAVSKKEAFKRLNKAVSVNEQNKFASDPFINRYLKEKAKDGFDQKKYIENLTKSVKLNETPSKEFLKVTLKEEGYTDEQVQKFFDSKTDVDLDLLAKSKKAEYLQKQEAENSKEYEKIIERRTQELETHNTTISSKIKQYGLDVLSAGKHPLKLAESELKEVLTTMEEMSKKKIVEIKGQKYEASEIDMFLGNDDNLMKLYPYIALEKLGKLDTTMHKIYSELKNNEFEKIDSSSSMGTGGSNKGKVNWAKMMS